MKLGLFLYASHPPERSYYDATQWDLEMIKYADELDYEEVWMGEHFTAEWEPIPAPDLVVAQALLQTKKIKLGVGAHLLPYHHPAELAHRVAYLDHLAQGRFLFGVGSSGLSSDLALFNVDGSTGENVKMTAEALEIILKYWTEDEPFEYRGTYWNVNKTDRMHKVLGPHMKPYQKPYPPIGVAGLSPYSETLKIAGQRGFIPMSLAYRHSAASKNWESVVEGAKRSGRTPDREDWRVGKNIFVAETDEEAYEHSVHSMMGRHFGEYSIPLFKSLGRLSIFKEDENIPDEDVTVDYIAKNCWFIGSPDTVAKKLDHFYEISGGFGTLLTPGYDYLDNPEVWKKSMRLLKEEVLPRLKQNRIVYY